MQVSRLGMPLTNEVVQPIGHEGRVERSTPFGVALPAAGSQQFQFDEQSDEPGAGPVHGR
ncbi:MAG: hypothetical protein WKG07_16505 [Hymenobacter sp.]